MISLRGERFAARVGSSLLASVGLEDLICSNIDIYEELAVTLAEDSEKLFGYRRRLERTRRNCAAFDTERWVRNFEKGLIQIVRRLESGDVLREVSIEDCEPIAVEDVEDLI